MGNTATPSRLHADELAMPAKMAPSASVPSNPTMRWQTAYLASNCDWRPAAIYLQPLDANLSEPDRAPYAVPQV